MDSAPVYPSPPSPMEQEPRRNIFQLIGLFFLQKIWYPASTHTPIYFNSNTLFICSLYIFGSIIVIIAYIFRFKVILQFFKTITTVAIYATFVYFVIQLVLLVFIDRKYLGDIVWKSVVPFLSFIMFNVQYSLLNDVISKWESTEELNDLILRTNT